MHATLIKLDNPFRPQIDRQASALVPGRRIRTILKQHEYIRDGKRQGAFVVVLNGQPILEKQWGRVVRDADILTVSRLPRGGGGSNPLQIVLMVALVAASIFIPGMQGIGLTMGTWQFAAASAAIMLGGTMMLNMMFPPPKPGMRSLTSEQTSPNYSLSAQGNMARLMEAIPVLYGRFKVQPDFAAQPYTEVRGADQYLYQLYCVTQGAADIDIANIFIGETPIANYPDVTVKVYQPGQRPDLFPTNVATSVDVAGQELKAPNESGYAPIGPFVIGAPGTKANSLAIDISSPSGVGRIDDNGNTQAQTLRWTVEYALVNDQGVPIGPWQVFWNGTATGASRNPARFTYRADVVPGRYAVRANRADAPNLDGRSLGRLIWENARIYLDEPTEYGEVTMIATVMKASNVLNQQTSRQLTCIGQRRLRKWDAVNGWSQPVATSNPAWAAADAITNPVYGRNLPDSRYNLQELVRLAGVWDARGDEFNGVFDTTGQFWDALTSIVRVGRAVPMYYAGLIDFIRDEPKSIPTAMFSPQNMVKNSFSATYQFAEVDTPDYVQIEYVDAKTWQTSVVDCALPDSLKTKAAKVEMMGITNHDQAWREGITMAARNRYQRRLINWSTELDGLIPKYGDLIQVSHDVPAWGYSGKVTALDKATRILTASEALPFVAGTPHAITFRRDDGSADGPYTCIPYEQGFANQCLVQGDLTNIKISDGVKREFTIYQFGPVERRGMLVMATSASPSTDGVVAFEATNYSPQIYAAETGGTIPPEVPQSNLPTPPQAPNVDRISLTYTFVVGQQQIVATPANGADYYEFEASNDATVGSDGSVNGTFTRYPATRDPWVTVNLAAGRWYLRVRGVGTVKGAWRGDFFDVKATALPAPTIASFTTATALFGVNLMWAVDPLSKPISQTVEIWHGLNTTLGNATLLATFAPTANNYLHGNMGPGETHYYWIRVIDKAGRIGPWFNNGNPIVGQSSSDAKQILDALNGEITKTQLSQELWQQIEAASDFGPVYAAINEEKQARIDGDTALTQITTQQATQIGNNASAITNEATTRANADGALSTRIDTTNVRVGNNEAAIQTVSQAQATTDGKLSAMWAVKVQATVDGKYYLAGIGVGIENGPGGLQSQVLISADRFAIMNSTNAGATVSTPFVVQGGVVYMNSAFIQDGTITNAKIAGVIQSNVVNAQGRPAWVWDKNGTMEINGVGGGNGRLIIQNNRILIFDENGTLRVEMGQLS